MTTAQTNKAAITADIVEGKLHLSFSHGEALVLDPSTLSEVIQCDAILHGLKQKLVDAAAIARNTDTGRSATIQDKYDAVKEVFDRITSKDGTWNKVRGGEGTGNGTGILVRALMQLKSKTRAEIEAFLEPLNKDQKSALRQNPKVAAVIVSLQAQNSKIDTDSLLEGL